MLPPSNALSSNDSKNDGKRNLWLHLPRPFVDAISGATAGAAARFIVSPLDVIKIRFQVQIEPIRVAQMRESSMLGSGLRASKYTGLWQALKDILREEGAAGLWRGIVPAQCLVMPYTAIQFVVYHKFKELVVGGGGGSESRSTHMSPGLSFLGGALAGGAATVGSYPFDLLRTILASQGQPKVYRGMLDASTDIFRTRGVRGLYAGLSPTIVEILPYAGLQFVVYDGMKKHFLSTRKEGAAAQLSSQEELMAGFAAGTVAKVCTHPLDVVKKRFQVEGLQRHTRYGARIERKAYRHMFDALTKILECEGWSGLYKGVVPSVIKAAPSAAITFMVYENVAQWLAPFAEDECQ